METIDVRAWVESAVRQQWEQFAAEHPHLAEQLSEPVVLEQTQQRLAEDPEFQAAMRKAESAGAGLEALKSLIARIVGAVFDRAM